MAKVLAIYIVNTCLLGFGGVGFGLFVCLLILKMRQHLLKEQQAANVKEGKLL